MRKVPLNRLLSKRGILSRSEATAAILAGRVKVDGRRIAHPTTLVDPAAGRITLDDVLPGPAPWRTVLFHKPRGVLTARRDPEGRPTVFTVLGDEAEGLVAVGRLDWATSGLLLLTTDATAADWITDPAHGVPRVYVVTVRGRLGPPDADVLVRGIHGFRAHDVTLRKVSSRESHAVVELREGKNREVRRLFAAIGHEVTRLKRVRFGGLELGSLEPGAWRRVSREELRDAFPGVRLTPAPGADATSPAARNPRGSTRRGTARRANT